MEAEKGLEGVTENITEEEENDPTLKHVKEGAQIQDADGDEENNEVDGEGNSESGGKSSKESGEGDGNDSEDPDEDITGIEKEPSYKRANKLEFAILCERLEILEMSGRKITQEMKKKTLLPPQLLKKIEPQSPFPIFRLIMPEQDSSRRFVTKEYSLGEAYADGYGLPKAKREMLKNYNNPVKVATMLSTNSRAVGDFGNMLRAILAKTNSETPSKATVGDINDMLDQLSYELSGASPSGLHHWRGQNRLTAFNKHNGKGKKAIREGFVRALRAKYKLPPLEHKWIARIILGSMKIGLGYQTILQYYNLHSMDLWKTHNSLKAVCNKLCNPDYVRQRELELEQAKERMKQQRFSQLFRYPSNIDPVRIGNTISAMKSERTAFESLMADMSSKHREVIKQLEKNDPLRESLALKFPAFISEVKLDGERMLVHINRGKVTMHTRQGRWYSIPYSPIVGPALRRSIARYDVDVILDGEILAWDDFRQENIPFGSNRTVSILRKNWLRAHGKLEEIDLNLHEGDDHDNHIITNQTVLTFEKPQDGEGEGGDQCWLKFVAFDLLYVDGPDANKLLTEALAPEHPPPDTGSITHMSGFERKRVLYRLIECQQNEVEIVQSIVIRPNGDQCSGAVYFNSKNPITESDIPIYMLDSAKWTLNVGHENLKQIDNKRRMDRFGVERTDLEISRRRTQVCNSAYHEIVDRQKCEGLVFKDLAIGYVLRSKTRLWLKIKPDYSGDSFASDLDVLIIGGSFATGLKNSGMISSFLCGCADSQTGGKQFFTFCRINANSLKEEQVSEIMSHTGFAKATKDTPVSFGKWFNPKDDGGPEVPDFISHRSFQEGAKDGWIYDSKTYPDLFIRPDDSLAITVNAGEIVPSEEYSAGYSLRFPRAKKVRWGADDKPLEEIEDEESIVSKYKQYREAMEQNVKTGSSQFDISSPSKKGSPNEPLPIARFITAEQYLRSEKVKKKRKQKASGIVQRVETPKVRTSHALAGLKFTVLEGDYSFDETSIDAEAARKEGWFEEARAVQKSTDVAAFIVKHGGKMFRSPGPDTYDLGGSSLDLKVVNRVRGFDVVKDKEAKNRKREEESQSNVPGVLKWTYVFSLVFRWQQWVVSKMEEHGDFSSDEEDNNLQEFCIMQTSPGHLEPRFFDFLAQSKRYGDDPLEAISRHGDLDLMGMKRALRFLEDSGTTEFSTHAKRSRNEEAIVPWQQSALESLRVEDRWIMVCGHQQLWPYQNIGNSDVGLVPSKGSLVVLYPDIFGEDFGRHSVEHTWKDTRKDPRWDSVDFETGMGPLAATLPLVRSMGAVITCHLHTGVTHVLCNLPISADSVEWRPRVTLECVLDCQHGRPLLQRLEATVDHPVLLVSREWVMSKMDE